MERCGYWRYKKFTQLQVSQAGLINKALCKLTLGKVHRESICSLHSVVSMCWLYHTTGLSDSMPVVSISFRDVTLQNRMHEWLYAPLHVLTLNSNCIPQRDELNCHICMYNYNTSWDQPMLQDQLPLNNYNYNLNIV